MIELLLWFLPVIFIVVVLEGFALYSVRPRGLRDAGSSHVHQGPEVSRHEVNGRTVIVAECRICHGHFNFEATGG